jgi:hypothetical protein
VEAEGHYMDKNSEEAIERINFEVTGELAEWMADMKRRGLFFTNPEIIRLALTYLRHHYRQTLGETMEQEKKENKGN